MAKDNNLLMYGLLAVGGYLVYTYLRDSGALLEMGIAPTQLPATGLPPVAQSTGQGQGQVDSETGDTAPPPPAPTLSDLKARIVNAASGGWGADPKLDFWGWNYYYEQATNGERPPDPFTIPAFQGMDIAAVQAKKLSYDEWAGYMTQAGYSGLSGRQWSPLGGMGAYSAAPQGYENGFDHASPWGQGPSGRGGLFNRG